jgi:hypothetical protein
MSSQELSARMSIIKHRCKETPEKLNIKKQDQP